MKKAAQRGVRPRFDSILVLAIPAENSQLPIGHFLGHVENQLAIFLVGLAQQAAKFVEETRFLAAAAPCDVVRRFTLGKVWQLRRFFTVVEELIKWAL